MSVNRHAIFSLMGASLGLLVLAALIISWLSSPGGVQAAELATIRYVTTDGHDLTNTCVNAVLPCASVQHAVDVAGENDVIKVAAGTYAGAFTQAAPSGYLGGTSITQTVLISGKNSLVIRGGYTPSDWDTFNPDVNRTILDANSDGRVLVIFNASTITVEGFIMTQGYSNGQGGSSPSMEPGGAVYQYNATATLQYNVIQNSSARGGGGVYMKNSPGTLARNLIQDNFSVSTLSGGHGGGVYLDSSNAHVDENTILRNSADLYGGGIYSNDNSNYYRNKLANNSAKIGGGLYGESNSFLFKNGTVISNTASESGGGFYLISAAASIYYSTIEDNEAAINGGGIFAEFSSPYITNSKLLSNRAVSGSGGGFYFANNSPSVSQVEIRFNTAGGSGGGGYSTNTNNFSLERNFISQNQADTGGGLAWEGATASQMNNSVIVHNQAGSAGSGLFVNGSGVAAYYNTLVNNTGGGGQGIYIRTETDGSTSTVELRSNLFASQTIGVEVLTDSYAYVNHSFWGTGAWGGSYTVTGTGLYSVTDSYAGVPEFMDPARLNYHIRWNSPAIQKSIFIGVSQDFDGEARDAVSPDIGADEFHAAVAWSSPARHDAAVPDTATLKYQFTGPVYQPSLATNTFMVYGSYHGLMPVTMTVDATLTSMMYVDPTPVFLPGETAQVLLAGNLQVGDGSTTYTTTIMKYMSWNFTAAATGGSGTFTRHASTNTAGSYEAALGDIDGDGDLDAVVANYGTDSVVLMNDGLGNFTDLKAATTTITGAATCTAVALGDLDRDGDLDAFFGSNGAYDKVWRYDKASGWTAISQIGMDGLMNYDVALADMSNEGRLDALVATDDGVKVYNNQTGLGGFNPYASLMSGMVVRGVGAGDIDNDGDLDVVAGIYNNLNQIMLNDGAMTFVASAAYLGQGKTTDLKLGDFNGDGWLDIYITYEDTPDEIWVNDHWGGFYPGSKISTGAADKKIALGDLDGDGDLDVMTVGPGPGMETWINNGNMKFSARDLTGALSVNSLALGDMDGDGDLDAYTTLNGIDHEVMINANSTDLAVSMDAHPDPVMAGDTLTYTLKVNNRGGTEATDVVLVDDLPAAVSFLDVMPAGPVCSESLKKVTCNMGGIPAGGVATVTIRVTPLLQGTYTNEATVTSSLEDTSPANNRAAYEVRVMPAATPHDPMVESVNPDQVYTTETVLVTLEGQYFQSGAQIKLSGPATQTYPPSTYVSTTLVFNLAAGMPAGVYDVTVTNPDGKHGTLMSGLNIMEALPPTLISINPAEGPNTRAVTVRMTGSNFSRSATATLRQGTEEVLVDRIAFIDSETLAGVIPANAATGVYDVAVYNHPGDGGSLEAAYTVLNPHMCEEFTAFGVDLWLDPVFIHQNQPATVTLRVRRLCGMDEIPVSVTFYMNEITPENLLGTGTIPAFPAAVSVATATAGFMPAETGRYFIYAVIDSGVSEFNQDNNVVSRSVVVLPDLPDQQPPVVVSLLVNNGDQNTRRRQVTLDTVAVDNVAVTRLLYVEYIFDPTVGNWQPVQFSPWLPYAAGSSGYPWQLTPYVGVHYLQVWAADRSGNISPHSVTQMINLLTPLSSSTDILAGSVDFYRLALPPGVQILARLTSVDGDADLYVFRPNDTLAGVSETADMLESVLFTSLTAGVYQVEVEGATDASYRLEFILLSSTADVPEPDIHEILKGRNEPFAPVPNDPDTDFGCPSAMYEVIWLLLPLIFHP